MITPTEAVKTIKDRADGCAKASFAGAFIAGLITHMQILVSDIPNHDGLASIYSDQDLLTSGRWFLGTACGISSFYSIPWFIGILSLIYIAAAAVLTVKILRIEDSLWALLTGILLAVFPTLASNFAYVFTMDGYMLGLLLAVLSVYLTEKGKWGFIAGGAVLSLSVGIYQAYLAVAMILCLYRVAFILVTEHNSAGIKKTVRYPLMGALGLGIYYGVLKLLLAVTGKALDDYQGIGGAGEGAGLLQRIVAIYRDFWHFTLRSRIMAANLYAAAALIILVLAALSLLILRIVKKGYWKDPVLYIVILLFFLLLPVCANMILAANTGVTYHSLMRYQWAFVIAILFALVSGSGAAKGFATIALWAGVLGAFVTVFSFAVTDNIAYGNLNKKYEKTYAYAVRLLDRIEETPGYFPGMPVKMIGVVGSEAFPETDVTGDVTAEILGASGDWLLYRPENYKLFMENYLGATVNFLPADATDFYFEDWYVAMHPFPSEDSVTVKDGVMYIKTENHTRN